MLNTVDYHTIVTDLLSDTKGVFRPNAIDANWAATLHWKSIQMARWHAIQVAARMEGLARSVLSIWSDMNKVENIKLFRRHRAATSNQWRVQADNVSSRTFVYIQTQHGGEANCSCVWAQTRANRSSNWAPVSLRYRWNRSSPRWSSWRDSEITPALCVSGGLHEPGHDSGWFFCISGTCTAGTVHTGDISHDRRGMSVIEKY